MRSERVGRTLLVALAVALFCSLVVSAAVTFLRPIQLAWEEIERNRVLLELAGLLDTAGEVSDREAALRFREIEALAVALPGGGEVTIWLRSEDGAPVRVILPVEGHGMWAPMRGFIALQGDCATVAGIAITAHGETPGIGDRIENPRWRASWVGLRVFDSAGRVALAPGADAADDLGHRFDAISGATVTVNAVVAMARRWLGEEGYGPLLARCRAGEAWQ